MKKHTGDNVKIDWAGFSLSWTTSYPSLLATAQGAMLTRAGYVSLRKTRTWLYPWQIADRKLTVGPPAAPIASDHVDSFWRHYLLNQNELYWTLDQDTAWDLVIPLKRTEDNFVLSLPDHDSVSLATVDVLFYPSAVSVVMRVEVTGPWSLPALVAQIADLRRSPDWEVTGAFTSHNRRLDGIASDIDNQVAKALGEVPPHRQSAPIVRTVAALISTEGFLHTKAKDVGSNLAGLAALQPAGGEARADGFLDTNRLDSHSARMYAGENGHVMWSGGPRSNNLSYLLRSQTELVAHIAALGGIVAWARDQVNSNIAIPVRVQPLVQRAARSLKNLDEGDPRSTYRAGISKVRIAPMADALNKIATAL